ncbi:MAG TPA: preprotein translocase subunit SecE [Bacilli bacterium]
MSEKDLKVKDKPVKKQNRLLAVFSKEYKHEGLVLLILALIAIVLGVMLILGILTIPTEVFFLGDYQRPFAWVLLGLGVVSLILAVLPYYKPSVEEIKRVTWPTKGTMISNSLTVFLFTLILALFFALIDSGFSALVSWLRELAR